MIRALPQAFYTLANVSAKGFAISSALPIHLIVLSKTVTMNTADMKGCGYT